MAVGSVFVSSVMSGFETIRAGAATGIERVGMHPVLAERLAAAADSPRRALLDEAGNADIYLLLLGQRYGEPGPSGTSPTEEEYEEAMRKGRPVLVLVQECEREPDQDGFLDRIRGNWDSGVLYDKFAGESDIAVAVAGALARHQVSMVENPDRAREQAETLAGGDRLQGSVSGGLSARLAMVPLREAVLLDPLALEDEGLGETMMGLARASHLVSQGAAIKAAISSEGIELNADPGAGWTSTEISISVDGSVAVSGSVQGGGTFGSSLVDPERLHGFLAEAGGFARAAWQQIDRQDEVGRVAVAAAIPNAQHSGFGPANGNSMSMGHEMPAVVLATDPQPVPRGQVGDEQQIRRLIAAIRRVYLDAGAVQEGG